MVNIAVGDPFPAASLQDVDGAMVEFPAAFANAPATIVFLYRGRWWPWCRAQVTSFVYEAPRFTSENIQVLGISSEPPEEGRKLRERVTRDCEEDRPQIPLDPYPLRLLCDPEGKVIRALDAANEEHWSGFIAFPVTIVVDPGGIVRWLYVSKSAADRPSPVALSQTAAAIAQGERPRAG
jgi:peroxiredoxin